MILRRAATSSGVFPCGILVNIFEEGELKEEESVRKIGNSDSSTKPTNYYNLDVIISVGYRVKSIRGTQSTTAAGGHPHEFRHESGADDGGFLGLNEDYDGIGMLQQQVFPKEALGHGPADSNNALKRDLQRKLASVYDCTSIANYIDNPANAANIEALSEAMKNKVRVVLKGYASAHGDETRDRVVEPFSFTANMIDVWAYNVEKADCRMYSG